MNKKGFTLVELLAVIAILAILVIIALPNVLKMYNDSKKNAFMTEAQNLAKEVSSKYISESMKGNKVSVISNQQNPLDMTGRELEYNFELDSQGKIKNMIVSNGTYCISTNKDYTKITRNDISDKCSYEKLHNIVGTLKNKFYEESGRTDRSLVSSIVFYSDGRTINGAESYDVSEKKDGSIKMYVTQNSENTSLVDLTIVSNGKIAFPEDSSSLLSFGRLHSGADYFGTLKSIKFNNSVDTGKVKNMSKILYGNNQLESLDLSGFNTSNVTNMSEMFMGIGVEELDVSGFDTSNVTDMSQMFYFPFDKSKLVSIKGLNKFNTSNVTNMKGMFMGIGVEELDLSSFDTSKVTDMSEMFSFPYNKSKLVSIKGLNKFNTSNVTNMSNMFSYSKMATLDLSSFDTSNVTNMSSMFSSNQAAEIKGLNKFNTSKVTDMSWMFAYSKATMLDLSSFNTSNVTDMEGMLKGSTATTGYAKDADTAAKFNDSTKTGIPDTLKFTVK